MTTTIQTPNEILTSVTNYMMDSGTSLVSIFYCDFFETITVVPASHHVATDLLICQANAWTTEAEIAHAMNVYFGTAAVETPTPAKTKEQKAAERRDKKIKKAVRALARKAAAWNNAISIWITEGGNVVAIEAGRWMKHGRELIQFSGTGIKHFYAEVNNHFFA